MYGILKIMKEYVVYLFVNISLQEVFFGMADNSDRSSAELPGEISHWDFCSHAIANPVMIEEGISEDEARLLIRELQEKSLKNPQGKKILMNPAAREKNL